MDNNTARHWETRVLNAVTMAAQGDRKRLVALAVQLESADLARDCLRLAGYGEKDDSLLGMVAEVLEQEQVGPDVPA